MRKGQQHSKRTILMLSRIRTRHPTNGMLGKHHSRKTRRLLSKFQINHPSMGMLGKHHSKKTRMLLRVYQKKNPSLGFSGKHHTNKTCKKISRLLLIKYKNGTLKPSYSMQGRKLSNQHKMKISKALKGRPGKSPSKITLRRLSLSHMGKHLSLGTRKKLSISNRKSIKKLWKNMSMESRRQRIMNTLQANANRPTSIERKFFYDICPKYKLPFSYCGNGTFMIGVKNPDGYEKSGKKICIEVNGSNWHKNKERDKRRIKYFKELGWKCIVIWDYELTDETKLVNRVKKILNKM